MSILSTRKKLNSLFQMADDINNDVIDEIKEIIDKYGKDGKIIFDEEYRSIGDIYTIVGDGVDGLEANLEVIGATNLENGDVGVRLFYAENNFEPKEDIGDSVVILSKNIFRSTIIYKSDVANVFYALSDYVDYLNEKK